MGFLMQVTDAEMGAMKGILDQLPYCYDKKVHTQTVNRVNSFLINLYKLRGNTLPEGKAWRYRYINTSYDVETRNFQYTFEFLSEDERYYKAEGETLQSVVEAAKKSLIRGRI